MTKRVNVRIFENNTTGELELVDEKEYGEFKDLPHGENPQQNADLYKSPEMVDYEILDNRELSYNEFNNLVEAVTIVSEFFDVPAVAIVQNSSPCGVALGKSIEDAYNKAFDCDPIASFSGTIGFSKEVNAEVAKHMNSMAVKVVVAPEFSKDALDVLKDNPVIKLVKLNTPLQNFKKYTHKEIKITPFGTLVQDFNKIELNKDTFKVVTKTKPTTEQIEDAVFAWKIAKYAKSHAVVIAKDFKTSAIAQGHLNPIVAVEEALNISCDLSKDAVMALDSTIAAIDCINAAAQGRISLIIHSGGSFKDEELVKLADKFKIAIISTGIKNKRN